MNTQIIAVAIMASFLWCSREGQAGQVVEPVSSTAAPTAAPRGAGELTLTAELGDSRFRVTRWLRGAKYCPDGKHIVAVADGRVCLLDADGGKLLWAAEGKCLYGDAVAVRADSTEVLVGDGEGRVYSLDMKTGKERRVFGAFGPRRRFPRLKAQVIRVACSADGALVSAADTKGRLKLWDLSTGQEAPWPDRPEFSYQPGVAFSRRGGLLAVTGPLRPADAGRGAATRPSDRAAVLMIFDARTRKVLSQVTDPGEKKWFSDPSFSPNGDLIAVRSAPPGHVELRRTKDLGLVWRKDVLPKGLQDMAFLPDGKSILVAGEHTLLSLDVETGTTRKLWDSPWPWKSIEGFAVSPDGTRFLMTFYAQSMIEQFDVKTMRPLVETTGYLDAPRVLSFSRDGRFLAAGCSYMGECLVWSLDDAKAACRRLADPKARRLLDVRFSPSAKYLVVQTQFPRTVTVYTWPQFKPVPKFDHLAAEVGFCFAPDEKYLAVSRESAGTRVMAFPSGRVLATLPFSCPGKHMRFSPDAKTLAVQQRGFIKLWDWRAQKATRTLRSATKVAEVRFAPSGRELFAAGPRQMLLWRLKDLSVCERDAPPGPDDNIYFGGLSSDGSKYVTAVNGRELVVRDAATGRALASAPLAGWDLQTLAISPDGTKVAAAGLDTVVRVYSVPQVAAPRAAGPVVWRRGGAEEHTLRLRLFAEKGRVKAGQDIIVKLGITNTGSLPCMTLTGVWKLRLQGGHEGGDAGLIRPGDEQYPWLGGYASARVRDKAPYHERVRKQFILLPPQKETVVARWDLSEMMPAGRGATEPILLFHTPGKRTIFCTGDPSRLSRQIYDGASPATAQGKELRHLCAQVPDSAGGQIAPLTVEIEAGELTDDARRRQAKLYAWAVTHAWAHRGSRARTFPPKADPSMVPGLVLLAAAGEPPSGRDARSAAFRTLGLMGLCARLALGDLVRLARAGPDEATRCIAIDTIGMLLSRPSGWLKKDQPKPPEFSDADRARMGEVFAGALDADEPPSVRTAALAGLAKNLPLAASLKAKWVGFLDAEDPAVRSSALHLYVACDGLDEKSTAVIVDLLKSPTPWVRSVGIAGAYQAAYRMQRRLSEGEPVPPLQARQARFERIVGAMVDIIAERDEPDHGPSEIVMPFYWRRVESAEAVRELIWGALRPVRDLAPGALAPLGRLANCDTEKIRLIAIYWLCRAGPGVKAAAGELEKALNDKSWEVSREAARALAFVDPANEAARPILLKAANEGKVEKHYNGFGFGNSDTSEQRYGPALNNLRPGKAKRRSEE